LDVILASNVDDCFEEEPAELGLNAIDILTERLHEGLTPVRVPAVLGLARRVHLRDRVRLVQQVQLPVDLLTDSQQLVR